MNPMNWIYKSSRMPPLVDSSAGAAPIALPSLGLSTTRANPPRIESTLHLRMPTGSTYWIDNPHALRITCQRGAVWLTIDNAQLDVVLSEGETIEPSARERLLISALAPSDIALQHHAA